MKSLLAGIFFFYIMNVSPIELSAQNKPNSYNENNISKKVELKIFGEKEDGTRESLPYASILVDKGKSTISDLEGIARLYNIKDTTHTITTNYMGYEKSVKKIEVKNNLSFPSYIVLSPEPLEIENVVVKGERYTLEDLSIAPVTKLDKEKLESINFLTGNSHTKKYYALTPGIADLGDDIFFNGADLGDFGIIVNGIQTNSNGFFGHDALYFGEFAKVFLRGIATSLKESRHLPIGYLSANTTREIKNPMQTITLEPLRTQITLGGPSNVFKMLGMKNKGTYNLFVEKNIADLWNLSGVSINKDFVLADIMGQSNENNFGLHVLYSDVDFSLIQREKSLQFNRQIGVSAEYKDIQKNGFLELSLTTNYFLEKLAYGIDARLRNEKITNKLTAMQTKNKGNEMFYYGADIFVNRFNILYKVPNTSLTSFRSLALPLNEKPIALTTMPVYPFFVVEKKLDEKNLVEIGVTAIIDPLHAKRGVPIGPYIGYSHTMENITFKAGLKRGLTHENFDVLRTGDFSWNEGASYPKIDQAFISIENQELGARLSYVNFIDQNVERINLDLEKIAFDEYNRMKELYDEQYYKDSSYLLHNQIYENKELLDAELERREVILENYLKENSDYYINTRNRQNVTLDLWYSPIKNFFSSISFSRTAHNLLSKTPHSKDIPISFKMYGKIDLLDNLGLTGYLYFRIGSPFTPKHLERSLLSYMGMPFLESDFLKSSSSELYDLMNKKRLISDDRNSSRYPPSLNTSLTLTYRFSNFIISGGLFSISVLNPHTLIHGVDKNVTNMYYDSKGNLKKSKDFGQQYTVSLKLNI